MRSVGQWPSLDAAHGHPTPTTPIVPSKTINKEDQEWDMLSPNDDDDDTVPVNESDNDAVVVEKPPHLSRKNSHSCPDLQDAEESNPWKDDEEKDSSIIVVPHPASSNDNDYSGSSDNMWLNKNKVSFKDAILTPSKYVPEGKIKHHGTNTTTDPPHQRKIMKSRYVVKPITRCAKSANDLLSLTNGVNDEEDQEEILGATDAQEYYNRKSHGAHGRNNGLKIRPDEAKRKSMIVAKKEQQRAKQKK